MRPLHNRVPRGLWRFAFALPEGAADDDCVIGRSNLNKPRRRCPVGLHAKLAHLPSHGLLVG